MAKDVEDGHHRAGRLLHFSAVARAGKDVAPLRLYMKALGTVGRRHKERMGLDLYFRPLFIDLSDVG